MRRTHKKTAAANLTTCAQCGEPKLPHRVCQSCGTYRGHDLIETDQE
jgi:large subunit ribosomal protein L32